MSFTAISLRYSMAQAMPKFACLTIVVTSNQPQQMKWLDPAVSHSVTLLLAPLGSPGLSLKGGTAGESGNIGNVITGNSTLSLTLMKKSKVLKYRRGYIFFEN